MSLFPMRYISYACTMTSWAFHAPSLEALRSSVVMDEGKKKALRQHHQAFRTGVIVANFLPACRHLFTDIEYSRVEDKVSSNVSAVDELIKILLTKGDSEFDGFCTVLRECRYADWARKFEETAAAPSPGSSRKEVSQADGSYSSSSPKQTGEQVQDQSDLLSYMLSANVGHTYWGDSLISTGPTQFVMVLQTGTAVTHTRYEW